MEGDHHLLLHLDVYLQGMVWGMCQSTSGEVAKAKALLTLSLLTPADKTQLYAVNIPSQPERSMAFSSIYLLGPQGP